MAADKDTGAGIKSFIRTSKQNKEVIQKQCQSQGKDQGMNKQHELGQEKER